MEVGHSKSQRGSARKKEPTKNSSVAVDLVKPDDLAGNDLASLNEDSAVKNVWPALANRRILLGVSGGIACYKAVEVLRLLKRCQAEVQVVLTKEARRFVAPLTFETLSGVPVAMSRLGLTPDGRIEHIQLAEWAEVVFVVPATANLMASYRGGQASETLSATLLATAAPVVMAPAMNNRMWEHPATQENVSILQQRGVIIIPPAYGELAEGWQAIGRLPEPDLLITVLNEKLAGIPPTNVRQEDSLEGKKILVTAGPTIEDIDPVRFIGNKSSGKMGYSIAQSCQQLGAEVTLVSGPVGIKPPRKIKHLQIRDTEQMRATVLKVQPQQDALILCAAVSDFKPKRHNQKIKRGSSPLILNFTPNPDIAKEVGQKKLKGQLLVIFVAEHGNSLLSEAKRKMHSKNADIVIANSIDQPHAGFDSDFNQVTLLTRLQPDKPLTLPLMPKTLLAHQLVKFFSKSMTSS